MRRFLTRFLSYGFLALNTLALAQMTGSGGDDVTRALQEAFNPVIKAACFVQQSLIPLALIASIIALMVGGIMYFLRIRGATAFFGVAFAGGIIILVGLGFLKIMNNSITNYARSNSASAGYITVSNLCSGNFTSR